MINTEHSQTDSNSNGIYNNIVKFVKNFILSSDPLSLSMHVLYDSMKNNTIYNNDKLPEYFQLQNLQFQSSNNEIKFYYLHPMQSVVLEF
jgi:hypothetical protein